MTGLNPIATEHSFLSSSDGVRKPELRRYLRDGAEFREARDIVVINKGTMGDFVTQATVAVSPSGGSDGVKISAHDIVADRMHFGDEPTSIQFADCVHQIVPFDQQSDVRVVSGSNVAACLEIGLQKRRRMARGDTIEKQFGKSGSQVLRAGAAPFLQIVIGDIVGGKRRTLGEMRRHVQGQISTFGGGLVGGEIGLSRTHRAIVNFSAGMHVDEETVYKVTRAIWEQLAEIHETANWMATTISKERGLELIAGRLHPGAARYYKEAGWTIGEAVVFKPKQ